MKYRIFRTSLAFGFVNGNELEKTEICICNDAPHSLLIAELLNRDAARWHDIAFEREKSNPKFNPCNVSFGVEEVEDG